MLLLQYVKDLIIKQNPKEREFNCIISVSNDYNKDSINKINQLCQLLEINCEVIIPNYICNTICYVYENQSIIEKSKNEKEYKMIVDIGYKQCSLTLICLENVFYCYLLIFNII